MAQKLCTPFCDGKKPCNPHHELLVALMNCSDQRCASKKYANMEQFQKTVKKCIKNGWKREDDVPDSNPGYQFPLIHWSCVLGKCEATQWLIENGFNPTVCSQKFRETALHRCVLCLHYTISRRYDAKVERIVDIMKDCLIIGDADQDTPLHVCAKQLLKGGRRDFFGQTLERMITKAQEMQGMTTKILDAENRDGNTIMHILARSDCAIIQLRKALEAGGSTDIRSKSGLTPLEVAVNYGNNKSIKLLREKSINNNWERERRKKENQKYLDRNTFVCESPIESPSNTSHSATDSEDESLATLVRNKGLPVRRLRAEVNINDSLLITASQKSQQDGSGVLTEGHTHDAVGNGDHSQSDGNSAHGSFSDELDNRSLDKRTEDGCHDNNESDISGSLDKGGDNSVVKVTSSQGDCLPSSSINDDRETDVSDNHGGDGNEASGNCHEGVADTHKDGSDSRRDSYHDNDSSATDGNCSDNPAHDWNDDDTIHYSSGGQEVAGSQDEGDRSHGNDATTTDDEPTNDAPAHQPSNGNSNSVDGNGSQEAPGNKDAGDNNTQEDSCNEVNAAECNPIDDSNADEPCYYGTITGDNDNVGSLDVAGNHGGEPDSNDSQGHADGIIASVSRHDSDAVAPGSDHTSTSKHRADSSSDNEMPVSCSSSNIEGQISDGDDDDEVTICKIKMEPPDLEYYTCCYPPYQANNPSVCSCNPINLSGTSSSTEGGSSQDSTLITLLQGAGLLENFKEMAASLRAKDEQQLSQIKNQKQSVDAELQDINSIVGTKVEEIYKQTQKLELLKSELNQLKVKKETMLKKRKRLEEEDNDLSKKLKCCDDLLKVVPNGHQ